MVMNSAIHEWLEGSFVGCRCGVALAAVLQLLRGGPARLADMAVTLNLVLPRIGISLMGKPPRQPHDSSHGAARVKSAVG